jgi:hypothetical protein
LLLLDNAEHLPAAASQIAELMTQAPNLTMLVTSRCPLHLYGEQAIPMRGLAVPPPHATPAQVEAAPAGRLLVERVRALDPEFTLTAPIAPALAAICARLDGLPLALELAAAHLRVLSPAALLARLDEPHAVLTGGARDLPARQQSLGASLDWSYGLLTNQQQTLFRRLVAVPDGARLHEIARICNPSHDLGADIYVPLEALVDQHLVRVATGPQGERYFYLPALVRAYALAWRAAAPADPADRPAKQPPSRLSERPSHLTLIVPRTEGRLDNTSSGILTKPGGAMSPSFTPIPRRPPDPCSHAPPLPCYRLSQLWAAQAGVGVAATPDHGLGLRRRAGAGTRDGGQRVLCGKLPVGGCRCPSVMVPVFVACRMRDPAPAGVIFALLLGGNTLRVLTESLAYLYGEPFYLLMGVSGFIEVAGLAYYAVLLWRALDQPSYGAGAAAQAFQDVTGHAPPTPSCPAPAQP